jgi:hypothetical protein
MWIGVWRSRRRGEKKFEDFCKRYRAFMAEDIGHICDMHHAEIHEVYDRIISEDKKRTGLPLSKYSWTQANRLMDKLERAYYKWLKEQTPGIFPRQLDARRRVRRLLNDPRRAIFEKPILQSEK